MSRRTPRKPLKLNVETLEPRKLLSQSGTKAHPALVAALALDSSLQQHMIPRPDLDAFASALVQHPRFANQNGLSGLSHELAKHGALASRHGWGATLVMELKTHPAYTAYHHLAGLTASPPPAPVASGSRTVTSSPGVSSSPGSLALLGGGSGGPLRDTPIVVGTAIMLCCQPSGNQITPQISFNSDVGLVTGEYLQNYQTAAYQSQGRNVGLNFQYSSLHADPRPVVEFNVTDGRPGVTSFQAHLSIFGTSGATATYTNTPTSFRLPLQANATGNASGVYPAATTLTENGTITYTETFTTTISVVNTASGPLGAGWSLGGLEQVFSGPAANMAMVASGENTGEQFTTADTTNYTGMYGDPAPLVHNGDGTWTHSYVDGTVVQFNSSGKEVSSTDRNGNATTYAYYTGGAASGALHTVTDPVGLITTLAYDSYGHLQTVTDPASRVTTFTIDSANGNLTQVAAPDGAVTHYGYSTPANHRITTEVNPNGYTATVTYDSFGRVSSEALFGGIGSSSVTPAQEVGLIAAGGSGPLTSPLNYHGTVTDPNGHTTTLLFDAQDHVINQWDANNHLTTFTRDVNGWLTAVTDPLNRTTSYTYDGNKNVTSITRPDITSMALQYNSGFGVPTEITDYRGLTTTYALDGHGNTLNITDPAGNLETFTYNGAGQALTATDANNHTTSFAYDSYGRLTTITYPGAGTPNVRIGYDSAGNVTKVTDELGDATTYTYDQAGRVPIPLK